MLTLTRVLIYEELEKPVGAQTAGGICVETGNVLKTEAYLDIA